MGPTVFHPYPRRLESLTVRGCHDKGSIFKTLSVGLAGEPQTYFRRAEKTGCSRRLVLVQRVFEPAKQTGTLPTELTRQQL